ncbi:MAG: hypothetical protein JXQ73_25480 [Phycisphaerae bacterium]|nr:hypothetical protein [Phycisphaerae bacterium]
MMLETSTQPRTYAALLLSCALAGSAGCSPKLKAIEAPGQTLLPKNDAAVIEREGFAVVLTPVRVLLEDDHLLAGMKIDLINQSQRPVKLSYKDVILIGGDGLKRPAMHPKKFQRYAELAQSDPPPSGPYRTGVVTVGVGYGGWHYYPCGPYGYPYGPYGPSYYYYDPYYAVEEYYRRRERIARFVSSLWATHVVEPGFVGSGHVVFDYEIRKKDRVAVDVTLNRLPTTRPSTRPTTGPTTGPSMPTLQPTAAGTLTFRFLFGS